MTMPDPARTEALRDAERRLLAAQLAADADELDRLIDDRLIFTGPDGDHYTKEQELQLQRSGDQALTEVSEEELTVLVDVAPA